MNKKRLLVTGGAGYIGSVVVSLLINKGYEVVVFDNLSTGKKSLIHPKSRFIKGDLFNYQEVFELFSKEKFDAVLHFAAFSQVGESVKNPYKYFSNNVQGSLNILEAMVRCNVKNIVFSSTAAVFGDPLSLPIDEEHPKNPKNPYGLSKFMVENMLESYSESHGICFSILRYFNASGADLLNGLGEFHDPETHLIPLILQAASGRRESISLFGADYDTPDGSCVRDYVHVLDLAEAHLLSLEYIMLNGVSVDANLGLEKGFSVKEVVSIVEEITESTLNINICGRREGDPATLISSSEKAKNILKWTPKRGIYEIVSSAWEWEKHITLI